MMTITLHQSRVATVSALAVHGSLTTRQVQALVLPGASHRGVRARLTRLSDRGVVRQLSGHFGVPCWAATPRGLGELDIQLPAVTDVGAHGARHGHIVSEVVIGLERGGHHVITERELRHAAAMRMARSGFATDLDGTRYRVDRLGWRVPNTAQGTKDWFREWLPEHLPDLCIEPSVPGAPRWAGEVELNSKVTCLIDQKLRWYRTKSRYDRVVYYCGSPSVARSVHRAAVRTGATGIVDIHLLPTEFLDQAVQA